MTKAPFFLVLIGENTVWCREHDAVVDTWTAGPPFADRAEAEAFIEASREWYEGANGMGHGLDHCLFRHPETFLHPEPITARNVDPLTGKHNPETEQRDPLASV